MSISSPENGQNNGLSRRALLEKAVIASLTLSGLLGCKKKDDPNPNIPPSGLAPTNPLPTAPTVPSPIPTVPAPALRAPVIFGFSTPRSVLNPTSDVENQIIEQLKRGVTEVPVYLGGNVTPDGSDLKLSGFSPDLKPFMDMLARIETNSGLQKGTIRIRPYVRASLTAKDAANQPSGPGKISLNNPQTRQNLMQLISDVEQGKRFGIDGSRIDEITLDFEDITASNYDPADLVAGDEGGVTQFASFAKDLKAGGVSKKIGVYCTGIIDEDWFPSESNQPIGSPFKESPRNFISEKDAELLFSSGVDVLELGAYSVFPKHGGSGGFANPNIYGPIFPNLLEFLRFQYERLKAIANRNPGLGLDPEKNLRIDIPTFTAPDVVGTQEAIDAMRELIRTGVTKVILGGVFDFGNLDAAKQQRILAALQ